MQKPETLETVYIYIYISRFYKNVCKLIKRVQKNNLGNKVVLVSVSEKARKVEREKRIKSIMENSKDSVFHYCIKQAEMLVLA